MDVTQLLIHTKSVVECKALTVLTVPTGPSTS